MKIIFLLLATNLNAFNFHIGSETGIMSSKLNLNNNNFKTYKQDLSNSGYVVTESSNEIKEIPYFAGIFAETKVNSFVTTGIGYRKFDLGSATYKVKGDFYYSSFYSHKNITQTYYGASNNLYLFLNFGQENLGLKFELGQTSINLIDKFEVTTDTNFNGYESLYYKNSLSGHGSWWAILLNYSKQISKLKVNIGIGYKENIYERFLVDKTENNYSYYDNIFKAGQVYRNKNGETMSLHMNNFISQIQISYGF